VKRLDADGRNVTDLPGLWSDDDRIFYTAEEAEALLPDGERIYVGDRFRIGAKWDRSHVLLALACAVRIEEAGPIAKRHGYGLCATSAEGRTRFIQTKAADPGKGGGAWASS
jgi:hypothetical protein